MKSRTAVLTLLLALEFGVLAFQLSFAVTNTADQIPVRVASAANLRPDPDVASMESFLKKQQVRQSSRKRLAEAIVSSGRRHRVDPRLVASIMIVESRGNPFAISSSDSVGIMQIHVPTWGGTVDREGINLFKIEDNVDFGVRILKEYVDKHGRNEGIKRYTGWKADSPESRHSAEAYLQKVQRIYSNTAR